MSTVQTLLILTPLSTSLTCFFVLWTRCKPGVRLRTLIRVRVDSLVLFKTTGKPVLCTVLKSTQGDQNLEGRTPGKKKILSVVILGKWNDLILCLIFAHPYLIIYSPHEDAFLMKSK